MSTAHSSTRHCCRWNYNASVRPRGLAAGFGATHHALRRPSLSVPGSRTTVRQLRCAASNIYRDVAVMSASGRVMQELRRSPRPMRLLGASGQLGYGIPAASFAAGIARKPDLIGCDMGSIDIGPTSLGKGEMATAPESTRRDLRRVLTAARALEVPLVIGSAGSAGAAPHLEATVALLRDIARADGLQFR